MKTAIMNQYGISEIDNDTGCFNQNSLNDYLWRPVEKFERNRWVNWIIPKLTTIQKFSLLSMVFILMFRS